MKDRQSKKDIYYYSEFQYIKTQFGLQIPISHDKNDSHDNNRKALAAQGFLSAEQMSWAEIETKTA